MALRPLLCIIGALVGTLAGESAAISYGVDEGECLCPTRSPLQILQVGALTCPVDSAIEDDGTPIWLLNQHPWTHRPFCASAVEAASNKYCTFTNAFFHGNHGISIIAAPGTVANALDTIAKAFSEPYISVGLPPYDVQAIPGKGKGAIANRKILKGEAIMLDYAALLGAVEFPARVKGSDGRELLRAAMLQLPDPQKVLGLGRSSMTGAPLVEDVLRTNTFSATVQGVRYMAIFPEVSRANHDCNPTAFTRFSENHLTQTVVAFRDIEPGEEITISYTDFGMPFAERQYSLKHRWGFHCTCAMCSSPEETRDISDDRRARIKTMRGEVLAMVQKSQLHGAIKLNKELIGLVLEEGLVARVGEHYEIMAKLYFAVGDRGNAEVYAKLALVELDLFGGPEVEESVKGLRGLLAQL